VTANGLLIIDKPTGMTSHDVVGRVRRILQTRKVGHAGTLDPDASGLLLLCVGDATRLLEYMTSDVKSYMGDVVFGVGTDTDDAAGTVIATEDARHLKRVDILAAAKRWTGIVEQQVPRYSAVHIDGRRAYDLARSGQDFEPPTRTVEILQLTITDVEIVEHSVRATFAVTCSKGTYIRSLCRDIGMTLGIPAHMSRLRRTQSGQVTLAQAVPLSVLDHAAHPADFLQNPRLALHGFAEVALPEVLLTRLAHGQTIPAPEHVTVGGPVLVVNAGIVCAVADVVEDDDIYLRPRKVLWKKEI